MATGTDVPIVDTAIQGWRDAIAAREKMPTLFWVAIVAMIGLGLVHFILAVWLSLPLIGRLALLVVQPLILTPFAIAIHQFVLLGEVRDNFDFAPSEPRFQKFFGYMIALELLGVIPRIIAFLVAALSFFLSSIVWLILAVVAAVIAVRTVILFPAIALDFERRRMAQRPSGCAGSFLERLSGARLHIPAGRVDRHRGAGAVQRQLAVDAARLRPRAAGHQRVHDGGGGRRRVTAVRRLRRPARTPVEPLLARRGVRSTVGGGRRAYARFARPANGLSELRIDSRIGTPCKSNVSRRPLTRKRL